jgi:uncharacterized membrane protein
MSAMESDARFTRPQTPRRGHMQMPAALRRRRRLRSELVQLISVVSGLVLGLVLPTLTVGPELDGGLGKDLLLTLGLGTITLVSVLFSLLFVVVQWASSMFTPRLGLFRDDPLVWRTMALSLGIFIYSVTAALGTAGDDQIPAVIAAVDLIAVLAILVMVRGLQLRALRSLQLAPTLGTVAFRGHQAITALYVPVGERRPEQVVPPRMRTVRWSGPPLVLQGLELGPVVDRAAGTGAMVVIRASIGDTLQRGQPLADLHGSDLPDDVLQRAAVTGLERTLDQDPLFAVRLLADIGLRALSTSVNDPATAVSVLDVLEALLREVGSLDLSRAQVLDADGALRVLVPLPDWEDFLVTGFDDLLAISPPPHPMVLRRAAQLLQRLRADLPDSRRDALDRRLDLVRRRPAVAGGAS